MDSQGETLTGFVQQSRLKAELGDAPGAARVAEIEAMLKSLVEFAEKLLQLSRAEAGSAHHPNAST